MNTLLATIQETRKSIDVVADDKKLSLVDSMMTLCKKLIDNVLSFADVPEKFDTQMYPAISDQIKAAEKRTEKAADDIMSATENIMAALGQIEGAGKDKIQTEVNNLFEACNFQDLVAQHLKEIQLLANSLKDDMSELKDAMGEMGSASGGGVERKKRAERSDAHLLNGPSTVV